MLTDDDIANDQYQFLLDRVPRYVVLVNIPREDDVYRQQLRRFLYAVEDEWFQRWHTPAILVRRGALPPESLEPGWKPTEEQINLIMAEHRAAKSVRFFHSVSENSY